MQHDPARNRSGREPIGQQPPHRGLVETVGRVRRHDVSDEPHRPTRGDRHGVVDDGSIGSINHTTIKRQAVVG